MRFLRVFAPLLAASVAICGVAASLEPLDDTPPRLLRHVQRILSTQADDTAACDAAFQSNALRTYLTALPTTAGLRNCAASNIQTLIAPLTAAGSKCSLTTLTSLFSTTNNTGLAAFTEFFNVLTSGLTSTSGSSAAASSSATLQTTLEGWTKTSTKNAAFCSAMNTQIGPCAEALLPALVTILQNKGACCGQLIEFYELAKLLVPDGKRFDQTIVDVLNGLHLAMCTTTGSDAYCGQTLLAHVADVVDDTDSSSLLSPLLLDAGIPLFALPDGSAACSALDATKFASRVSASGGSYDYAALSCCASGYASLLQSFDVMIEHLTGSSLADTLNLITGLQDATTQFKAPYSTLGSCSFATTCTKPSFTLTASTTAPVVATNDAKNMRPQEVKCTTEQLCDKTNVCTTVCKEGTVKIAPWVSRAISYQRNLSYAEPLCYTQLPATHNSATTLARGWGNRDQLINKVLDANNSNSYMRTNNQFLTVTDQLNLGTRLIEIDVHYYGKKIRDGHCSRVNFALLDDVSASLKRATEALLSAGATTKVTVEWQSSLMGCLPSLGGIRADEARAHADTVAEIAAWLKANPNDALLVYIELGSELTTFDKVNEMLALHSAAYGDLLLTSAAFKTAGSSWNTVTLNDLVKQGKRVALMTFSPTDNDVLFNMRTLCDGWSDSLAGTTTNAGKLVREFSSELHYATMSEDSLGGGNSSRAADIVSTSTIPTLVNAGVNFVAADGLDGAVVKAMVWSWAEKEPTQGDTAVEISAKDGRWYGVQAASTIRNIACVSSSDRTSWRIVSQGSSCPSGFAVGAPKLAVENVALAKALQATGADATAQLSVDLTGFPVITSQDEAAFEGAASGPSGGGGSGTAPTPSGQTGGAGVASVSALVGVVSVGAMVLAQ